MVETNIQIPVFTQDYQDMPNKKIYTQERMYKFMKTIKSESDFHQNGISHGWIMAKDGKRASM